MKNENFAERLFVDLKNGGFKIENPFYAMGGTKIGMPNVYQFNIVGNRGKYQFNEGPSSILEADAFVLTFVEAYQKLLERLKKFKHLKFHSLAIPNYGKAVDTARLEEYVDVVSRYLSQYDHVSDDIYERWDIMIEEIINA